MEFWLWNGGVLQHWAGVFIFLLAGFIIPTPGCKDVVIHHNTGFIRIYFHGYAQMNILRSRMSAFSSGQLGNEGIRLVLMRAVTSRIAPYFECSANN
jgi:hypothetical protein